MFAIAPVFLFIFFVVSTLHLEISFLAQNHFELILVVLAWWAFLKYEKDKVDLGHLKKLGFVLFGVALSPVLSSLSHRFEPNLFVDPGYRSFLKVLMFLPLVYIYGTLPHVRRALLAVYVVSYFCLGLYFSYRYFYLGEIREFDSRPLLKIRHGDPNFLAAFIGGSIPLFFLMAQNEFSKIWLRVFSLMGSGFLIICVLVTESRMGIMALCAGLIVLLFVKLKSYRKSLLVSVPLVIGLAGVLFWQSGWIQETSVVKRFSEIKDKSSVDRLATYENGLKVFFEFPFLGIGFQRASLKFYENTRYPEFQSESKRLEVHNTYLSLLAELGIFGLAAFLGLLIWSHQKCLAAGIAIRPFLLTSFWILFLASLTVNLAYKDLFVFQFVFLGTLAGREHSS